MNVAGENLEGIAVERAFTLAKQKYKFGLITSRLDETIRCSIVLFILAMNVNRICRFLFVLIFRYCFSRCKQLKFMLIFIQNNNVENLVCC